MKVRFSFNLDAWILTNVEGKSIEDCKDKLYKMSIGEMLEAGYVEETDIKDVDATVIERTVHVKVTSVDYDISDWELPDNMTKEDIITTLPQTFDFEINIDNSTDLDDAISDAITNETGWCVNSCAYKIISEC